MKLGKSLKYIIYKLSDDNKEIIVEETSNEQDWEVFRKALLNAKTKNKQGKEGTGPRYAVYDFDYELAGGEGKRFVPESKNPRDLLIVLVYEKKQDRIHRVVPR